MTFLCYFQTPVQKVNEVRILAERGQNYSNFNRSVFLMLYIPQMECNLKLYYILLKPHGTRVFAAELLVQNIDIQKEHRHRAKISTS